MQNEADNNPYSIAAMAERYGEYGTLTPRGHIYLLASLATLHESVDTLEKELAFERKVNARVNEIFKGWFHREG